MSSQVTEKKKNGLPPVIRISKDAAAHLQHLYDTVHNGELLRLSVSTKGCSGKSYDLQFVKEPQKHDTVVEERGVQLLVDPKAVLFVIGSEMDYEETDLEEGFTFRNPNEKGRCGCGESFHV